MKFPTLLAPLAAGCLLALLAHPPAHAGDWEDAQAAFSDYDDAQGLRLLERAARQGDVRAMQAWGLALRHGRRLFPGMPQGSPQRAAQWFDKVAQRCATPLAGNIDDACLAPAGGPLPGPLKGAAEGPLPGR